MPIFKKNKLCFLHIPKTAGTTIIKALEMDKDDCIFSFGKYKNYNTTAQHLRLSELRKEVHDFNDYKCFTVVRNPFDRYVSAFFHQQNAYEKCLDLFTKELFEKISSDFRIKWFDAHFENYSYFLDIEHPIKIFKYEKLKECFNWIENITKKKINFKHERKNKKNNKKYFEYLFKKETIDLIKKFYIDDFYMYNYNPNIYNKIF